MKHHRAARPRLLPGLRLLPLLILLLWGARPAEAQVTGAVQRLAPSDTIYEIRLQDGSTLYGRVVTAEADRLVVTTEAGVRIELERAQIQRAVPVRGRIRDGAVWLEDPNRTRLFFGPTGRSLRGGEGYVGAFELVLPFVAYGITDRITIAGGTPIIPEVIGRIFYLAPKVALVTTERVHLATGVLAFFDPGELGDGDPDVVGIAYGAGTWGSEDDAVSAGVGWAFAGDDVENRPAFMLGGEKRVSRRVKLITESYLVSYVNEVFEYDPSDPLATPTSRREARHAGVLGAGIRIFGERLAGDLGLGLGFGEEEFGCCVPLVNFVYNF